MRLGKTSASYKRAIIFEAEFKLELWGGFGPNRRWE